MYSVPGDTTSLVPGFPIRTSSDPRSVDSSPRLIAASHVLHRLPVPRHPPCALKHLQTQKPIFEIAHQRTTTTTTPAHPPHGEAPAAPGSLLARCSQPLSTNQTPHPTTKRGDNNHTQDKTPGATPERAITASGSPLSRAKKRRGLVVSKPNSVSSEFPPARTPQRGHSPIKPACLLCTRTTPTTGAAHPTNRSHTPKVPHDVGGA